MDILLTAATEREIEPFQSEFSAGNIEVFISGVGVPTTVYGLQKKINARRYDMIIQAGICGSFSHDMPLGTTVLVKEDCFGDMGFEENGQFNPISKSDLSNANEFPFTNGWLENENTFLAISHLGLARSITVNKITNDPLQIKNQIDIFNPEVETMEGAALHFVCLQERIPFVQIRTVSNFVGERDKTKWRMNDAIANLGKELSLLLQMIQS
jgi:futalosine hydrolase